MSSMNIDEGSTSIALVRPRSASPAPRNPRTKRRVEEFIAPSSIASGRPDAARTGLAPGTPLASASTIIVEAPAPEKPSMYDQNADYQPLAIDALFKSSGAKPKEKPTPPIPSTEDPAISSTRTEEVELRRRLITKSSLEDLPAATIALLRGLQVSGAAWNHTDVTAMFSNMTILQLKNFCTGILTITKNVNSSDLIGKVPDLPEDALHLLGDAREVSSLVSRKATKNVVFIFLSSPYASMDAAPGRTVYDKDKIYNVAEKKLSYGITNHDELIVRDFNTQKWVVKTQSQFAEAFLDAGLGRLVYIKKNSSAFISTKLFFLCFTVKTSGDGTVCIPNDIGTYTPSIKRFRNHVSTRKLIASVSGISGANRSVFSEVFAHFSKSPVPLEKGVKLVVPDMMAVIDASKGCLALTDTGMLSRGTYKALSDSYSGVLRPMQYAPFFKAANASTFGLATRPIVKEKTFDKFEEPLKIATSVRAVTTNVTEALSDDPYFISVWLSLSDDHTVVSTDPFLKGALPPSLLFHTKGDEEKRKTLRFSTKSKGEGIFIHEIRSSVRDAARLPMVLEDILTVNIGSTIMVLDRALQIAASFLKNGIGAIYDPVLQVLLNKAPKTLKTIVPTTRIGHHIHVFPQYAEALVESPVDVSRGFYFGQAVASINIQHQHGQYRVKCILKGTDPTSPLAKTPIYAQTRKAFGKKANTLATHFFSKPGKKNGIQSMERALRATHISDKPGKVKVFTV